MSENVFLQREENPRQRILVVDDDRSLRLLNTEVLASHGYEVATAGDGAAAWDELQHNHYDLLVTDNEMPFLSGVELIQQLHDAHLNLPVIMVTGTLPQDELARHPDLQIEAILLKPYTIDVLLDTVKNVLHATGNGRPEITPPGWQHPSTDVRRRFE